MADVKCHDLAPIRAPNSCHTVQVGGSYYRYSILAQPDETLRELIIVDRGGPGNSALAASGAGWAVPALGMDGVPSGVGFVALEEPWVTRPVPAQPCAAAASGFLATLVGGALTSAAVAQMKERCADFEYGWSPARYRDVVAAISHQNRVSVTAFVGSSFAAYRLGWLAADPRFEITLAAMSNPLLPELSADDVLRHQADAISRRQPAIAPFSDGVSPGEVLAATASQLADTATSEVPKFGSISVDQVRGLSDTYLGRYDDDKLSLSRLAYYQELCAAGFSVPGKPSWHGDPVDSYGFLATLHSGCPEGNVPHPRLLDGHVRLCVAVSAEDSIIPFDRTRMLLGHTQYYVSNGPHSDAGALKLCRDFLFGQ